MYLNPSLLCLIVLNCLNTICDAVRLYREKGFRDNTFFYHNGDGGHAYHYNLQTQNSIYFKCIQYERLRCPGRAVLRINGSFRHSKPHNHQADPDLVGERHFRENILEQVRNARRVSFQDIIDEARRDRRYSRNVRRRMNLRRLRTPMYRARTAAYPPVPETLRQLTQVLLGHPRVSETVDGEENMYAGSTTADDGSHHVVLVSRRMLNFMGQCQLLQGDGTFRARPATPRSAQCFSLVTTYRDGVIPIAWILMETKTKQGYLAVFRLLRHLCPNLNPQRIVTDWELAQQQAWQESFPDATIQGCVWHLCRAFIKKANKLRILRFRRAFPNVLDFIRKACVICLLPEELFDEALAVLRERARGLDHISAFILRGFFTYIERKWLGNQYRRMWMNFYQCLVRTNNSCESHNRMLRKAVGAYRPYVYAFLEAIARLEHNAYLDYVHMRGGGDAKATRRWKSFLSDRFIIALTRDLEEDLFYNRDETIWNFLNRASLLVQGAFNEHLEPILQPPNVGQ